MTDATDEQAQREAARRALLGDIDSIRKLLELKDSSVAVSTQGIPVLGDIVDSALKAGGQPIDELPPQMTPMELQKIPLLTETTDGRHLESSAQNLRTLLESESSILVDEAIEQVMPAVEQGLREALDAVCRQHIDALLGDSSSE